MYTTQEYMSIIIAADTAFKKTEQADYSVLMVLGIDQGGDIYLIDLVRNKWDFPELKKAAIKQGLDVSDHGETAYISDGADTA